MNLPLQIDRGEPVPLQDQLFEQLRQLIVAGTLKPNSRVVATRFLADQVGVSRTTVLLAYERLISEGYLEARPAIGTFVCSTLPEHGASRYSRVEAPDVLRQASLYPPVFRSSALPHPTVPKATIDFSAPRFDTSYLLPTKLWVKGVRNLFAQEPDGLGKPLLAEGVTELRRAISDYVAATRGILASPEQIIIVSGRRQAYGLVAHLFQRPGDRVVVGSPGEEGVVSFFRARSAQLVHVPVDEHGLETGCLPQGAVSMAYVVPTNHTPLGGTMPLSRRNELVEWAREARAYIIEDDSGSEFRYHKTTPPPLAVLDPYGLVFHVGSFATTLGTGIGLGYLIAPSEFVENLVAIKSMAEDGRPWLGQMFVANLLTGGGYDHHLRRVRKIYLERRDGLIDALQDHFGHIRLIGTEVGTQFAWVLPERFGSAQAVCEAAGACGVKIECAANADGSAPEGWRYRDRTLVFGYAGLPVEQLRAGVSRLAHALSG